MGLTIPSGLSYSACSTLQWQLSRTTQSLSRVTVCLSPWNELYWVVALGPIMPVSNSIPDQEAGGRVAGSWQLTMAFAAGTLSHSQDEMSKVGQAHLRPGTLSPCLSQTPSLCCPLEVSTAPFLISPSALPCPLSDPFLQGSSGCLWPLSASLCYSPYAQIPQLPFMPTGTASVTGQLHTELLLGTPGTALGVASLFSSSSLTLGCPSSAWSPGHSVVHPILVSFLPLLPDS